LTALHVAGNLFPPGPIPINFYGIPTLNYFDGSANQYTGSIPIFAGPIESLVLANNTSRALFHNLRICTHLTQFILDMQFSTLNFVGSSLAGCVTPSNFDGPVYTCHFGGNVMCCPEGKELACDADITQCTFKLITDIILIVLRRSCLWLISTNYGGCLRVRRNFQARLARERGHPPSELLP
jgi:hypothetical protein